MVRAIRHLVTALAACGGAALLLANASGTASGASCASPPAGAPGLEQKAAMVCLVNDLRVAVWVIDFGSRR